jgi:hypothetical protein
LVPVATSLVLAGVVIAVALVFFRSAMSTDERGLKSAEDRVVAAIGGDVTLVAEQSSENHSRTKTFRTPGGRSTVEADLRRRLDAKGLLYPPAQDPLDDSIPLRTGPRYYVEVFLSGPPAGPTTVQVFTYIED